MDSRRRVPDDGEDEDQDHAEAGDESVSEGSVLSDGDEHLADASGLSEAEEEPNPASTAQLSSGIPEGKRPGRRKKATQEPASAPAFASNANVDAIANGLKPSPGTDGEEALNYEDTMQDDGDKDEGAAPNQSASRRHAGRGFDRSTGEATKEAPHNAAVVPNRGGFFMHDQRNNARAGGRGKGRGRGAGDFHK